MSTNRTEIRKAIRDLLIGKTDAADRVYVASVLPKRAKDLPAILIRSGEAPVDGESHSTAPLELLHRYAVEIVPLLESTEDTYEEDLDTMYEQIRAAMATDRYLGQSPSNKVGELGAQLQGAGSPEFDIEGDRYIAAIAITYVCPFYTQDVVDPATADEFLRIKATHKPAGFGDGEKAVDEFTVEAP